MPELGANAPPLQYLADQLTLFQPEEGRLSLPTLISLINVKSRLLILKKKSAHPRLE